MKKIIVILLGIGVAAASVMAQDSSEGRVKVQVKLAETGEGHLQITLFDSEQEWLKKGVTKSVQVNNEQVLFVEFENLKNGVYAISVIHDENSNGELDTTFGIPTEAYGFSNNARGMFGPASFADSKFEVAGKKEIEINIK